MQQQFSQNWYCMGYIGILAIRPYLPNVLCLCEVTKDDGKANEAILERYMIVLNDLSKTRQNWDFSGAQTPENH